MEKRTKYAIITLSVLFAIALLFGTIFVFLWGKSSAEAKQLKEEKKRYLNIKHEQDSIIDVRLAHIKVLTDSINYLVESAIQLNDGTDVTKSNIDKAKQKMDEEINNVPSLSVAEQLKLFAKQSEEYRPR
jgi:signal transduction histidine kinase